MFWFLVSVVLLVIWLTERSSLKKQNTDQYNRGWWDGYGYLKDKLGALGKVDSTSLKRIYTEAEGAAGVQAAPEPVADTSLDDPGAIYQAPAAEVTPQPVYQQEYVEPQPTLTAEDIAAAKERRTLQNLNTLLYLGSFLIVAAAAVFVTLVMPAAVKLTSLVLVTLAFYIAGLVLHATSARLKPAALAFVGTGLAIIPFIGFALTSLGGFSGQSAWFITSLVGLVAYGVAAVRLQSQLVSYLTMAFVLSLALSAVSTLGLSILWYFIVTMGVSVLCNSLHYLWPTLLPNVFWQPVQQTGIYTTPIALVASLFTASAMDLFMYEVLFGLATAHYLVVWLERRSVVYELVIRALAHTTLFIVACDVTDITTQQGIIALVLTWVGLAAVQIGYSMLRVRLADTASKTREVAIISVMLTLIMFSFPAWAFVHRPSGWVTAMVAVVGVLFAGVALRMRQIGWLYGTLAATVLLPFLLARWVAEPAVPYEVVAVYLAGLGALSLVALERAKAAGKSAGLQLLLAAGVFTYGACVVFSGMLEFTNAALAWTSLVTAGLFVLVSYVLRSAAPEMIGALLLVVAVAAGVDILQIDSNWQFLVVVVASAAVLLSGALAHHTYGERTRRNGLAVIAAAVFAALGLAFYDTTTTVQATATALLVLAGMGALALRITLPSRAGFTSSLALCAYIAYPVLALPNAMQAGAGWLTLVTMVIAGILWVSSYIEKVPALLVIGHVVLYAGLHALWSWLDFSEAWRLFGTVWLAAGIWYLWYWYSYGQQDAVRQLQSFVAVQVALGLAALSYLFAGDTTFVMAAAGSLLAASGTLAVHGYLVQNKAYMEVAVYAATLGLQRMVAELLPELNMVLYAHWWALMLVLVAVWRKQLHTRFIVALAFVTASTGWYALIGEQGYSLFFLIEHLVVAIVGAVLRKQWAMWWGIIAVVLAILYFLRNYTALALLFLGFLLILFVIWRLLKVGKK